MICPAVGGRYKLAIHRVMHWIPLLMGLVGPLLQAALLVILVRRKLYLRFRFFFAYTLYSIVASALQLSLMGRPVAFYIASWIMQVIYGVLALLAIREVFKSVLEMYYSLYRWSRWIAPLAVLTIAAVSIWQTIYRHPAGPLFMACLGTGAYWFMLGVLGLEAWVFAICLKLGLRRHYPIRWSRYEAGILVGFGGVAFGGLPIYLARFGFGTVMDLAFLYIPPVAYAVAALVWLAAFYRKETPVQRKPTDPQVYKRAAEFMRKVLEETEDDLGLRFAGGN